jgi:nucleobase transporter 1/2
MAVGGIIAFFLDNTIPGTLEERGLTVWRRMASGEAEGSEGENLASFRIYDLPFCLNRLSSFKVAKYLPFVPYYPSENVNRGPEESTRMMDLKGGDKEV